MSCIQSDLAKGWVTQYESTLANTNWADVAGLRQRRFTARLKHWQLRTIIQCLPILIHIASFLFASGLVVPLVHDDICTVLALVVVIILLYVVSTLHSVCCPDSPFRTPLSSPITWSVHKLETTSEYAFPKVLYCIVELPVSHKKMA